MAPRLSPSRSRRSTLWAREAFNAQMPPHARWKADNYNHLLEQPTLFYAVTLTLAMLGAGDRINTTLAWSYVALRILHSLVQATTNVILQRFSLHGVVARPAGAGGPRGGARLLSETHVRGAVGNRNRNRLPRRE